MLKGIIAAVLLILALGGFAFAYWGGHLGDLGGSSEGGSTYVPPPIDENPPMNGDAIDSLAREREDRRKQ